MISELNERSRAVFRYIVDTYLVSGQPVGSRTIALHGGINLSPASIRNTMADLEDAGLLHAPHTSAGRLPTAQGLRLYIDGLMQVGALGMEERARIESACTASGRNIQDVLEQSGALLSGLSSCASLVIAPKAEGAVRQVQFVSLAPRKILTILVMQNGLVENRVVDLDEDIAPSALITASNYLNAHLAGQSLIEARAAIVRDIEANRSQLDAISQRLVLHGLDLTPAGGESSRIIVRGQSRILSDVRALEDLERARALLGYLDEQKNMLDLLQSIHNAEGVQIFIGAENRIFNQAGWSLIISPYRDGQEKIVGAIGVIGPTRLDYDRIIPMVDYTSQVIGKLVDGL